MQRRTFLAAAAAATSPLAAGCSGDDGSVPGQSNPSETTSTESTTTTTRPALDTLEPLPSKAGSYTDYMVSKEGANIFLSAYYPRYKWLIDKLPNACMKRVVEGELASATEPTGLVEESGDAGTPVEKYFYGFTDKDQLTYDVLWGSFDVEAAIAEATGQGDSDTDLGFEATGTTVGDFELYRKSQTVFGLTEEMMITTSVGFADPVKNFRLVHDQIMEGGESFVASHENFRLLTEHLTEGHRIFIRPSEGENLGIGTKAYGRQFALASENRSIVSEVMVWDEQPTEDQVTTTITEKSGLYSAYGQPEIADVTIDGRVATVTYPPMLNGNIYRLSGYTGC